MPPAPVDSFLFFLYYTIVPPGYFNANSTESENIFAVLTNFLNNPPSNGQTDGAISQMGGLTVKIVDRIALILVIIGALNWGSIGLFRFDLRGRPYSVDSYRYGAASSIHWWHRRTVVHHPAVPGDDVE